MGQENNPNSFFEGGLEEQFLSTFSISDAKSLTSVLFFIMYVDRGRTDSAISSNRGQLKACWLIIQCHRQNIVFDIISPQPSPLVC